MVNDLLNEMKGFPTTTYVLYDPDDVVIFFGTVYIAWENEYTEHFHTPSLNTETFKWWVFILCFVRLAFSSYTLTFTTWSPNIDVWYNLFFTVSM